MNDDRESRVKEMEARLDRLSEWLADDGPLTGPVEEDHAMLEEYYSSSWREDYEADERGEFPADLPRGVLSQDALYNALMEYDERIEVWEESSKTGQLAEPFRHTNRKGFWYGFIDFFTAGLFFVLYMPLGGLQEEIDTVLGHRTQRYYVAYLLGIPTLFIYTLVWMANICEELKEKAIELDLEGPHTSWWHMFGWNLFGCLCFGPMIATHRFFKTLNKVEAELNTRNGKDTDKE